MKNYVLLMLLFNIFVGSTPATSAESLSSSYLHINPTVKELVLALSPKPALRFRGIEHQPVSPKVILDIKFDFDSAQLTNNSISLLQTLGKAITSQKLKNSSFAIIGHTDGTGAEEYNQKLSALRAQAVKQFLTEQHGALPELLHTEGRGESELLFPQSPDNPDNRRVEIINLGGAAQ